MSSFGAPSFYKIFFSDFSTELGIPIEFAKKYEEILPQITLLASTNPIISWDVKIRQVDDHLFIRDGWLNFVKDNKLTEMDLLVFHLTNKSSLQVAIYGKDGCLKELSSPISDNSDPHPSRAEAKDQTTQRRESHAAELLPSKEKTCESSEDQSRGIKSFTADITHTYKYHMVIPKPFAQETGLITKSSINMQNLHGKDQWPVKLVIRPDGRLCMTKGWNDFRKAHNLDLGDKCLFEFDSRSGNLVLKNKIEKPIVKSAKRERGMPPKIDVEQQVAKRGRPRKINVEQHTSNVPIDNEIDNDNGCEREISDTILEVSDSIFHNDEHSDSDESNDDAEDSLVRNTKRSKYPEDGASDQVPDRTPEENNPLYFEIVLKLYHRHKMSLPKDFWVAAELAGKETVGLEYVPKHCYKVVSLEQTNPDPDLMDMTSGWPEFRKGNEMVVGKRYAFAFEHSKNVIQIKEMKNTAEEESSEN